MRHLEETSVHSRTLAFVLGSLALGLVIPGCDESLGEGGGSTGSLANVPDASASTLESRSPGYDASIPGDASQLRDVLMVGNSISGTVTFIDPETYALLGHVDVLPDWGELKAGFTFNPIRAIAYQVVKSQQLLHHFEPGGGDRFVDDLFVSPDGTVLYVSRSNLGNVAAFDLTKPNHPLLWRTYVDGFKADHATISPDGRRLVVSATSARLGDVLDTKTGKIVGTFPTGQYPHQNDYSADGKYIYNSSIGNVGYNAVSYEDNAQKGDRWLIKVDAATLKVVQTWKFDFGIRPSVITADEKIMYAQLSYLNGVIKYDLTTGQEVARSDQPLSDFGLRVYATYDEYPHDSAHHGLALSGDGKKLCDCGTIDNNVAIVTTADMKATQFVDVGPVPYWATTSPSGRTCLVSVSGGDVVSVIDYESERELTTVPTGKFPQRSRLGKIPASALALLKPGPGDSPARK
jgi:DNA-binding beta-propeller fold protein YncE